MDSLYGKAHRVRYKRWKKINNKIKETLALWTDVMG